MKSRLQPVLQYAQVFFYLAFVALWFKTNFAFLKRIQIPAVLPLGLFLAVTILRIILSLRRKAIRPRPRLSGAWTIPVLLLLMAAVLRIPFLLYYQGLFNSDDVFASLMAKHISEGLPAPVYHYGHEYLGTPAYHLYALVFKVTGPSNLAVALIHVAFYLCFILCQYLIFLEITGSRKISGLIASFYSLPIGELLGASFFFGGNTAVHLFLGSLCLFLALRFTRQEREEQKIPAIGFLLGLTFWLHPITYIYALSCFFLIALKVKLHVKRYLPLGGYFLVGFFPTILNEIDHKLGTARFLMTGEGPSGNMGEKARIALRQLTGLFSPEPSFWTWACLALTVMGIVITVGVSLRKKRLHPEIVFIVFALVFPTVYFFSKFSEPLLTGTRYLWPLYTVIPFLLFTPFLRLPDKLRTGSMAALLLLLVGFHNAGETYANWLEVKKSHQDLTDISASLKGTGKTYWAGEFWEVILLSGLTAERIVGWSYTHEDYYPYTLRYFNDGDNNNYLFFKNIHGAHELKLKDFGEVFTSHLARSFERGKHLIQLLHSLNIPAKTKRVRDCWLVYDIAARVFPQAVSRPIPQKIPDIILAGFRLEGEFLHLSFSDAAGSLEPGFRLLVEIPGYSSVVRHFSPEQEEVEVVIPFPPGEKFSVRTALEYYGLRIPSTAKEIPFPPSGSESHPDEGGVIDLSGFGPMVDVSGKAMRLCTKKTNLKIVNQTGKTSQAVFHIHSPFQFSNPYWYGAYQQQIDIFVDHQYLRTEPLRDGPNLIAVDLGEGNHLIGLAAKYQLPFDFAPLWLTSFLMEKVELKMTE